MVVDDGDDERSAIVEATATKKQFKLVFDSPRAKANALTTFAYSSNKPM